jgi:hypothetical protein
MNENEISKHNMSLPLSQSNANEVHLTKTRAGH